jgi:prolyl-tRNA editing enzyme YbaK/EbsC (Cys-tRNA(Pro) deacylase)
MEVAQLSVDEHVLQCVVFGSWLPDEELEEGLECCLVADELMNGTATLTASNDVAIHKEHPKKHKNHVLKTLSRLLHLRRGKDASDKIKFGGNDNDEASVATTAAETTCSSLCSSLEEEDEIPLMQTRLIESGVVSSPEDFAFVVDKVSKEVINNFTDEERENDDPNMAHVKTGVWQVTCLNDDGTLQDPFYIVTGVCMEDKVDTKKLRKAIFAGKTFSRRPKLSLAPTEIAEKLAGFQSGTMAPICHTVDMKLFLEESIIANIDTTTHKIIVGSGMFGKCLSISTDKFLEIAKANPKGVVVCSLIKTSKVMKKGKK